MALDLESLRYDAGMSSRTSSYSGIGKEGGSKAWAETYDKIMNSKESVSFYLVAAQEHLDYITAKDFAIMTAVENIRKEQNIIKILEPLNNSQGVEANRIYGEILNTLGLEASKKETFGAKLKAVGSRIWEAIKEAFRKLKLAIVNIIAAIRRWFAQIGQGDSQQIYEKSAEIKTKLAKVKTRTIKAQWPTVKKEFFKDPGKFVNAIVDQTNKLCDNMNAEVMKRANVRVGASDVLNQTSVNSGPGGLRTVTGGASTSINHEKLTRYGTGYEKSMAEAINKAFGSGGKGWVNDKGGIIKIALYGNKKQIRNVKYEEILGANGENLVLLSQAVATNMKNSSNALDATVKKINTIIGTIEKMERNYGDSTDKSIQRANLTQLSYLRSVVSKMAIMGKDAYTEFFKIRGKILTVAKSVLKGSNISEIEYQKNEKAAAKGDKNIKL